MTAIKQWVPSERRRLEERKKRRESGVSKPRRRFGAASLGGSMRE